MTLENPPVNKVDGNREKVPIERSVKFMFSEQARMISSGGNDYLNQGIRLSFSLFLFNARISLNMPALIQIMRAIT